MKEASEIKSHQSYFRFEAADHSWKASHWQSPGAWAGFIMPCVDQRDTLYLHFNKDQWSMDKFHIHTEELKNVIYYDRGQLASATAHISVEFMWFTSAIRQDHTQIDMFKGVREVLMWEYKVFDFNNYKPSKILFQMKKMVIPKCWHSINYKGWVNKKLIHFNWSKIYRLIINKSIDHKAKVR